MNESRPRYGVYAFFKNHESLIKDFLNSVRDADEIILCDAGSTDGSKSMIEKYITEHPILNIRTFSVYIDPWRYDDIRNIGLSLMSPSIDLCLSLDIEERLVPEWKSIIDSYYDSETAGYECCVEEETEGLVNIITECRIHRNRGCFWKYPIFEELIFDDSDKTSQIPHVIIKRSCKKYQYDIVGLLNRYIKEHPYSWIPLWRLAQVFLDKKNFQDAHDAVERALKLNGCDKAKLYELKAGICLSEGHPKEALRYINKAISYKDEWKLYLEKARILSGMGCHTEAYSSLLEAKRYYTDSMSHSPSITNSYSELETFLTSEKKLALEEIST